MKTIAVIGHGLSPKGHCWGSYIDAADRVIRMWNYHWQEPIDYGIKYDYGFYEVSPTEMARFYKYNQHRPGVAWLAAMLHPYRGNLAPGTSIRIDPQRWVYEAISMGGVGENNKRLKLTRGAQAAAWAIELQPERVVLVGFDNTRVGTGLPIAQGWPPECVTFPATFPFRNYTGGNTKYSSHDYAVEGPFLAQLAKQNGVELVHAQDVNEWG
jgi:hypothetical protein